MKRLKVNNLLKGIALITVLASLSGCSLVKGIDSSDIDKSSSKELIQSYLKNRSPDDILSEAQANLNNSEYIKSTFTYSFKYLDKSVSSRVYQDYMDCTIRVYPEGERYSRSGTLSDDTKIFEYVYIVPTEMVTEADGIDAVNDVSEQYSKFISTDNAETWSKTGTNELWGTKVVRSLNFNALVGAGLELESKQKLIDGVYTYHVSGNLTWEQAQNFLNGLTESFEIKGAEKATSAKEIKFDGYFYQNCRPFLFTLEFDDNDDVSKDFTYTEWTINGSFGDVESGKHLEVPSEVREQVILKAREQELEDSYELGGIEIEVPTEESTEESSEEATEQSTSESLE